MTRFYRAKRAARSTDHVRSIPRLRKARRARQGTGRRPLLRALREPGRRLGGAPGHGPGAARAEHRDQGLQGAAVDEPAPWLRLPRLRLAGSEAHQLLRVLRERRQGCLLRAHGAQGDAGILRRLYRQRAGRAQRLLAGGAGPASGAHALRRRDRPLCADQLGGGLRHHRPASQCAGQPRQGRFLHLRPRLQRIGLPLSALRPPLRDE